MKEELYYTQSSPYSKRILCAYINKTVSSLGAPVYMKGYRFLCEAIEIVCKEPWYIDHIVGGLYTRIAEENNISPYAVERDIRTVVKYIQLSERLPEFDDCFRYFPESRHSLSAKKFVVMIAQKVRNDILL